jgi:hypothetical protein
MVHKFLASIRLVPFLESASAEDLDESEQIDLFLSKFETGWIHGGKARIVKQAGDHLIRNLQLS